MTLPRFVHVCEVGPREGMQIEKGPIATADKIELVDRLSACHFPQIEVTSFVSAQWVPQMADADEVVARMRRDPSTRYTAVYLNAKGLQRALATERLNVEGWMLTSASETFALKNTNKTLAQMDEEAARQVDLLLANDLAPEMVVVMASFGCNYQGDVAAADVVRAIERTLAVAREKGQEPGDLMLADSMGWVTPATTERLVGTVRERWPDKRVRLHLHDTRGLALASALTAMHLGVDHFESSVGGLGGCPFGNYQGAAGNMVTEDFVHLCHESGVETGIDLDRLIDAAQFAERIVGHALPGKVMHGGSLRSYR
jgi:hydroxymethylglutaryl-CoA lyase